jgi:phosphoserine phosphatase
LEPRGLRNLVAGFLKRHLPAWASSGEAVTSRHLLTVLEVSRDLVETTDLPRLLERITESALRVLSCERASVFVYDPVTGELRSLIATGSQEIRFPANLGIAGEAFQTGCMVNIPDAYADARFNPEIDRRTGYRTRNLLTCPLNDRDNRPVGVLQVLNKRNGTFSSSDELLARTFSAQAGMAIQRHRLLEELVAKQRIEHELEIASKIQQAMLPKAAPVVTGFDIAGWNRPADLTGGDLYDFVTTAGGDLAVVVADVVGHGIGPALVMAECRALIRSALLWTHRVDQILAQVNTILCEDLPDDRFVTAFLGILKPALGKIEFFSAGHGPILLRDSATGAIRELPVNGCPLGLDPESSFREVSELSFAPGDTLAIVTDGFFEWCGGNQEQFGIDRLNAEIGRDPHRPASLVIEELHRAVLNFAGNSPQLDDLTAVIIKAL